MKMLILQLTRSLNTSKNTFATELHSMPKSLYLTISLGSKTTQKSSLQSETFWWFSNTVNMNLYDKSSICFILTRLENEGQSSHTWFEQKQSWLAPFFNSLNRLNRQKIKLDDRRDDGIPSVVVIPNYETHKASSGYFCLPNRNLTHLGL